MKLEEVFASVLSLDPTQVTDGSSPATVKKWDSLRHMKLIVALEKAYGVTMTPGDARKMQSVAMARTILRDKGKEV
jgi:acyl carrier protein